MRSILFASLAVLTACRAAESSNVLSDPATSPPAEGEPAPAAPAGDTDGLAGGATRSGAPIGLSTKLSDLMDVSSLNSDARFGDLTVEHFLAMAPNVEWRERYEDDIRNSSIISMLWLKGYKDMAKFAANEPIGPEGI